MFKHRFGLASFGFIETQVYVSVDINRAEGMSNARMSQYERVGYMNKPRSRLLHPTLEENS